MVQEISPTNVKCVLARIDTVEEVTVVITEWWNGEGFDIDFMSKDKELSFKQSFFVQDFEELVAILAKEGFISIDEVQETLDNLTSEKEET